jgi:hypothetical protein
MDDGFGHWLAGFIDGEATFLIKKASGGRGESYSCGLALSLRADDLPILREIQEQTGCGRITGPYGYPPKKPFYRWSLDSFEDTRRMVELLDRYPLRAKKAKDYAVWREAVLHRRDVPSPERNDKGHYVSRDWSRMLALKADLEAVRVYADPIAEAA